MGLRLKNYNTFFTLGTSSAFDSVILDAARQIGSPFLCNSVVNHILDILASDIDRVAMRQFLNFRVTSLQYSEKIVVISPGGPFMLAFNDQDADLLLKECWRLCSLGIPYSKCKSLCVPFEYGILSDRLEEIGRTGDAAYIRDRIIPEVCKRKRNCYDAYRKSPVLV